MHRVVVLAIADVVAFDLSIPAQIFGHQDQHERYSLAVAAPHPGLVQTTTGFAIDVQHGLAEAAAGILDGRRATTHWHHTSELQERYPKIDVDPAALYIEEGTVATSAGIAAGIDLCLQLVRRDAGSAAAAAIARRMVVPTHRSGGQAQYIEHTMTGVSTFASVCDWALTNLDATITVDQLARRAGWSPRTFTRRFTKETGMPPHRWLITQRLALARELLEGTDLTVEDIAVRAGFGGAGNLRAHFQRETGVMPSLYRQTFSASAAE